jgi:3-phytase
MSRQHIMIQAAATALIAVGLGLSAPSPAQAGAGRAEVGSAATEVGSATRVGDGSLVADIEGVTVAGPYLIVSWQGSSAFAVYRTSDHTLVRTVRVGPGQDTDGCQDTDGVDAVVTPLGTAFPHGLFVCQDGVNTPPDAATPRQPQNFKFVQLQKVIGSL